MTWTYSLTTAAPFRVRKKLPRSPYQCIRGTDGTVRKLTERGATPEAHRAYILRRCDFNIHRAISQVRGRVWRTAGDAAEEFQSGVLQGFAGVIPEEVTVRQVLSTTPARASGTAPYAAVVVGYDSAYRLHFDWKEAVIGCGGGGGQR